MERIFGTDGVRGVVNKYLTPDLAYRLGRAGAFVIHEEIKRPPVFIIGMDTRLSGSMLAAALSSGICAQGGRVIDAGTIPTPGVAHLVGSANADAGVMISASHNSFEDNGIKFFNKSGMKLADSVEDEIQKYVLEPEHMEFKTGGNIGIIEKNTRLIQEYELFLQSMAGGSLQGMKIILDCANGAASDIAPYVFNSLGAEVLVTHNKPDGININKNCGSTHLENLKKTVLKNKGYMGFAFDGDADRVLAVDETGAEIDGDQIMAISAIYLKEKGKLLGNTLVVTVMSNLGLEIAMKEQNINLVRTKVGDRYVLEEMLKSGYVLGGEQSGHIIFSENNKTGDGIATALTLLSVIGEKGISLKEAASVMKKYPQILVNAKVKNENKHKYLEDEYIASKCKQLEDEFQGRGRVLIRTSGTEALVRVMIEGQDQDVITAKANELSKIIAERLG